jgi:dUTP pyrophosphatase
MQLNIKLFSTQAKVPQYAYPGDAGMDLYAAEKCIIPSHSRKLITTDIAIQWRGEDDENYYLRIAPRSGLAVKGIDVGAGVIDFSYCNIIKVLLINNSHDDFHVNIGDRIAQGILEKIRRIAIFNIVDDLEDTERGGNGFGSSGI